MILNRKTLSLSGMQTCITVLVLLNCGFFSACKSEGSQSVTTHEKLDSNLQAMINFESEVNDLGIIQEGEKVVTWFDYTNTGKKSLVINNIKTGCGCTVPQWKREPINPGETASIKIVFDSKGKKGMQHILIRVYSNAVVSEKKLTIKARVLNN